MRLRRFVTWLPLLVAAAIAPTPVLADHCGARASVTPSAGPVGTTFVFTTNLGAPSDLHLYRDGLLVRSVFLDDSDFVTFAIRTRAVDAGAWRARAEVRGQSECAAEAAFVVLGAPDTSTEPVTGPARSPWILPVLAGAVALLVTFRRSATPALRLRPIRRRRG